MDITSINNPKIKYFQKLKEKKYRDQEKLFLVEDFHLVNEALKKGIVTDIITINKDEKYNINTYYVTEKIMKSLSSQVSGSKIIAVCKYPTSNDIKGNIIVLDNLQDPGNLGTIIRSAVAFNFDSIILSNESVDVYNPKVIRASEGMIFNINIIRCDIEEFLNNLSKDYIKITTSVNDGEDIRNIELSKCALIIGNEGNGVRDNISRLCDKKVYINMNNNCESLNAAIAASILMYEVNHE